MIENYRFRTYDLGANGLEPYHHPQFEQLPSLVKSHKMIYLLMSILPQQMSLKRTISKQSRLTCGVSQWLN